MTSRSIAPSRLQRTIVSENYYDVTNFPVGSPYEDIGAVINSIIADIKSRQPAADLNDGGKPGAVIYIPPGDYRLVTQVVIDVSYLKIVGSGHGFTSSSIRFNTPEAELAHWHERWPGEVASLWTLLQLAPTMRELEPRFMSSAAEILV